jgi:hypothetical protein
MAVRDTWARVLRHTTVVEDNRFELLPLLQTTLRMDALPVVVPPKLQFPPTVLDGAITLPALKVVHGFLRGINRLAADTYIDLWPVNCLTAHNLNYRIAPLPAETQLHVMLVLCDFKTDTTFRRDSARSLWRSQITFTGRGKHLAVVLRAINPKADEGDEPIPHHSTFLQVLFRGIAQCTHERYTLVGFDEIPPRLLGLPPSTRGEELRYFLQSNPFLQLICDSWLSTGPQFVERSWVTPMHLKTRVRCVTTQEWRDEIGEEAWAHQTLAARGDLG